MYSNKEKARDILSNYNGYNPYLLYLKSNLLTWKREETLSDFNIEFTLRNHDFKPVTVNKIAKIAKWFGEKKKEAWNTDFLPEKVYILTYLGDTERYYCFILKYRQGMEPINCFIPKNAMLSNPFREDYHKIEADFDRYDRLSTEKDKNRKLKEHQKDGVKFLLNSKKCILADEQGAGKTATLSVSAIEGNFDSVLIICPASLKTNWKNELMWYVPERDITIVDGFLHKTKDELEEFLGYSVGKSGKKKDELLAEAKEQGKWVDNRFVIVNFDILDEFYSVTRVKSEKAIEKHVEENPLLKYIYHKKSLIIIDEAHKLSNSTSNRYKIINNLIRLGEPHSIYLSTGTPVTNMPSNLYCLLKLIDAPITCDWDFFTERYCGSKKILAKGEWKRLTDQFASKIHKSWQNMTNEEKKRASDYVDRYGRKITIMQDPENLDELKEAISDVYLRREKSDVTSLPKKIIHEVTYTLSDEEMAEYERLWDEYEKLKSEEDPDKELNKELLEGGIYRRYLASRMVPRTIELADSIINDGKKVVIACCFDNELYELKDYYGDRCVIYNGKCNSKQKDAAIEKFKNDDNVMVFIGNIIASGTGITLTKSHNLIFSSFDYVYANNSQMEDRVHRIGQDKECHIYYQMFEDTHCFDMWNIVLKKQYVSETLITAEK